MLICRGDGDSKSGMGLPVSIKLREKASQEATWRNEMSTDVFMCIKVRLVIRLSTVPGTVCP